LIGILPMPDLAPLEYWAAFDAALTILRPQSSITIRCSVPELAHEAHQRIPVESDDAKAGAALWVEPLVAAWESDLTELNGLLPPGTPLVVIASLPLARLLPERQGWAGDPLCLHFGGLGRLRRALKGVGFSIQDQYGFHTPSTTGLNALSRLYHRWGRPDLADRLGFAARLRYCTSGPLIALSTVALIVTRKAAP
jgi:hypothetical protein